MSQVEAGHYTDDKPTINACLNQLAVPPGCWERGKVTPQELLTQKPAQRHEAQPLLRTPGDASKAC